MAIRPRILFVSTLLVFSCAVSTRAQHVVQRPLITEAVDEGRLVTLRGNTHPLARPQFDVGTAAPDLPLRRMLLVLKRSPEQDVALAKFLDDQQDKASPNYHKWLTPDEFGAQFGPADQDIQAVTGWLQSHGLQVNRVTHGKTIIEFTGTAAQVQEALHAEVHKYLVNGEEHWANNGDPQIPAALAPAVAGVRALNNFPAKRFSHLAGVMSRDKATGHLTPSAASKPLFTLPVGRCGVQANDCYGVGPYDFATIYDVLPAWNAAPAIDGAGETIAIVGETDINVQDVVDFRSFFGLPAYGQSGGPTLKVVHDGPAPGILRNGEEAESDLDVEWSGAVAKGANIDFVVGETTETTFGIDLAALHIIDNNLAPVMSESYGICELFIGNAGNQFFNALWQQAAAQGITVMLASGDGSAAGCDNFDVEGPATFGLQVSGFASTPYNVAVGGTDFDDLTTASNYWSTVNDSTTHASALSYVPETTWDDNCTNPVFGNLLGFSKDAETNCNNSRLVQAGFVNILGGSGGKSNCISSNGSSPSSCQGGYPKPSWQNAPGVPADGVRDVPDVSLFAAVGSPSGSFYLFCEADLLSQGVSSCNANDPSTHFLAIGGTSASSPAFAGIMALVNQQTKSRQGNANFVLYKLAQQHTNSFNDVTTGTIAVPCQTNSTNCKTATAGHQFGILTGYNAGPGYDLATGLGSVDVNNLLQNWSLATFTATMTTLNLNPTSNLTHGQAVTVTGSVAPSSGGSGIPTGPVALLTSGGLSIDGFSLSNGAISGTTNLLPGGSYTVVAHYGGDATFGGSQSAPVSVTVTKESSSSQLELVTFDWQGRLLNRNATTAAYGSPYILRVNVLNGQGAACQPNPIGESGCPTGNITLTDNGTALDGGTFSLNSLGYAEDRPVQFPGGSNAVRAQYPGDASFISSSATATYAITPATTTVSTPIANFGQVGAPFSTSAMVQSHSSGAAPGGTVTFFANGTPIAGTPVYSGSSDVGSATATLTANLTSSSSPFPTPGTYGITASYNGDGNYAASTSGSSSISVKYAAPTIAMGSAGVTVASGASVNVTAIVDTQMKNVPTPTGTVQFTYWGPMAPVGVTPTYSTVADSSGNVALLATINFVPAASASITASYEGDSNYPAALGGAGLEDVTVTGSDFAMVPSVSSVPATQGGVGGLQIYIQGQSSYSGTISFTSTSCAGLPRLATCSFNPATVTGIGSTNLTVNTIAPHRVAVSMPRSTRFTILAMSFVLPFSAVLMIAPPRKRFARGIALQVFVLCLLVSFGCGGGSGGGSGGNSDPGTPRGSYLVTVTGTSGSTSHTATFTLVVQ